MRKPNESQQTGNVSSVDTPKFVERCILDYGRYTIEDRAVSGDLDGLKPSQRRLVVAMNDDHMYPGTNFRKSAKAVAGAMGNYHPHGDAGLYAALVGMVHDRYPLVEGHGNFGNPLYGTGADSIAPPAASRYTEVRLTKLGKETVDDLSVLFAESKRYVVPREDNYDGSLKEPVYLPARLPLLLLNGSAGIAVAVSVTIPPHNLAEVVNATVALIKNPAASTKRLLKYIKGPDYPEGGVLLSSPAELRELYRTGRGNLRYRCAYSFETPKGTGREEGGKALVVTSGAPGFNIQRFMERCAELKEQGVIISAADESGHGQAVRLVVEINNPRAVEDYLIPMITTSVSYRFFALTPKKLKGKDGVRWVREFRPHSLKSMLETFIKQRRLVEKRLLLAEQERVTLERERCEARLKVTNRIDDVVKILKDKKNDKGMQLDLLQKRIGLTQRQAEYVLTIPLGSISAWSVPEQEKKIGELNARLKEIANDLNDLDGVLIRRLEEMKTRYSDERRTVLAQDAKRARLRMKVEDKWLMLAADGGVRAFDEVPTKRGDYPKRKTAQPEDVLLAKSAGTVTAVLADGGARELNVGYVKPGFLDNLPRVDGAAVIGAIAEDAKVIVAGDEKGMMACVANPVGKASYKLLNTKELMRFAVGLGEKDKLVILGSKGKLWWSTAAKLPVKRHNVKGARLCKMHEVVQALVVRPGDVLYDNAGQPFALKMAEGDVTEMKSVKRLYAIGEHNLVISEGTPRILDRRSAAHALRKGVAKAIFSLVKESTDA